MSVSLVERMANAALPSLMGRKSASRNPEKSEITFAKLEIIMPAGDEEAAALEAAALEGAALEGAGRKCPEKPQNGRLRKI